jgi:hypothetical protein
MERDKNSIERSERVTSERSSIEFLQAQIAICACIKLCEELYRTPARKPATSVAG